MRTLTCRCRYCAYVICHSPDEIGLDARCPRCGQTIRLPGNLATVTSIRRVRKNEPVGVALELLGFASAFVLFPYGLIVAPGLLYMGWRKTNRLVCANCGSAVASKAAESCPGCKAKFSGE